MSINKYYSYSAFIGPCIESGWTHMNYSGQFSYGGVRSIAFEYSANPATRMVDGGFTNIGQAILSPVSFQGQQVFALESSPGTAQQFASEMVGYPASGYIRLYGDAYIPSTNTTVSRASVAVGDQLFILTGYNTWLPFNLYFYNSGVPANNFTLSLRDGNIASNNNIKPSLTLGDGEICYFRNMKILVESGKVPFTGDTNINLIQELDLVQDIALDINNNYSDLKEIGKYRMNARENLFYPDGNVTISYIQHSLANEIKFGFNPNFTDYVFNDGRARYNDFNYDVMLNLTGKGYNGFATGFVYPFNNNKKKNLFINVITNDQESNYKQTVTGYEDIYGKSYTVGLGNAYLKSYRVVGSYNTLPLASVSYTFFNLTEQPRDFGKMPCLHAESGSYYSGQYYWLPSHKELDYNLPIPARAIVDISGSNALFNLTGALWREYDFSLDFNTKQNERIGYALPDSCDIQGPNKISIRLQGLVNEEQEHYLNSIHSSNGGLNLAISYYGCIGNGTAETIRYDFRGCKIDNIQTNYSIGQLNAVTVSLTQELSQPKNGNGFFMSGYLWNNPKTISKSVAIKNKDKSIDFIVHSGNNFVLYGN